MKETISVQEIIYVLRKQLKVILAFVLGAVLLGIAITFFIITPKYQADTQILVNQQPESQEAAMSSELETNLEYINTYNVIITSTPILQQVIEETGINQTVGELQGQISVAAENESQVAVISVEDIDPAAAVLIANKTAEVFEREVPGIMQVDNVSILSKAQMGENTTPVSPQPFLNLLIALAAGLMAGIGMAFLREHFDSSIKSGADIEATLGLPLLGTVATITDKKAEASQVEEVEALLEKEPSSPMPEEHSPEQKTS